MKRLGWYIFQAALFVWIYYEIATRNEDFANTALPFLTALAGSWLITALIVDAMSWPSRIRRLFSRVFRLKDKTSGGEAGLVGLGRHLDDSAQESGRLRVGEDPGQLVKVGTKLPLIDLVLDDRPPLTGTCSGSNKLLPKPTRGKRF